MPIGGDVTVTDRFLAIDWGTTNRRVYLLDASGTVHETFRDDRGVLRLGRAVLPTKSPSSAPSWATGR
jgi:2-dehydro-3-deoxygalactonokinase